MSRKLNAALVCLVAMSVLGSLISTSASAAPQYKIEGSTFTGTETITPKILSAALVLESHLPGAKGTLLTIGCKGVIAPGAKIFGNNKSSAESITFVLCTVSVPAACTVENGGTIKSAAVENQVIESAGLLFLKFSPAVPPIFVNNLALGGGCEGIFKVKGSAQCLALAGKTPALLQGCQFSNTTASNLTFGPEAEPKPATLSGLVGFELSGTNKGKNWAVS